MPELGSYGSVRGAVGNSRPYRKCRSVTVGAANSAACGRRSKTSKGGNRGKGYVRRCRGLYGDLASARGTAEVSRWG